MSYQNILMDCGFNETALTNGDFAVHTPIDGGEIARIKTTARAEAATMIEQGAAAFKSWRTVPPPRRGELVRLLGNELRREKDHLGALVSLECGKILSEGLGEVQEMIDICDFAVGLSRQLYGLTMASERPAHAMRELWHPLGLCGIITAFNFPVAPWCWNAAIALVCGNPILWKPSEKTPLTALAVQKIAMRVMQQFGDDAPAELVQTMIGDKELGVLLTESPNVALVSATGSVAMGRSIARAQARRLGRCLLELGGNNGMIVAPSADLSLAERAIVFSAVGTAGQRCTSLRRLVLHESIYEQLMPRLKKAYDNLPIGSPLADDTLVGPLIDKAALDAMQDALNQAQSDGGTVYGGETTLTREYPNAAYVHPAIVEMPRQTALVCHETFAPILYVMKYTDLAEAVDIHNGVPQGLSSCIFSNDVRETEYFLSACGSDCGIANVNIGPSGAEIGGAFGGEKDTGGGRESGSDAWKNYMRRQTATINYSRELPLAQGVKFDLDGDGGQ